jgi:hypothetical protein
VTGRAGDPPAWPLTDIRPREEEFWPQLWRMPQAVEWERLDQTVQVALYVRRLVDAEAPGTPTNLTTLVRQLGDSLGLTIPGMRALRWKVSSVAPVPKAEPAAGEAELKPPSTRERFRVIRGAAG